MANMTISARGMQLLENFEGLRLTAYRDSAGILTIGFGHTGKDVAPGMTIDKPTAVRLLTVDLQAAVAAVNHLVRVAVTQNQFDALVDFAYNAGVGALATSELLKFVNAGDFAAAAAQFPLWDHAGGKVVEGLLARRKAEAALFLEAA